MVNNTTKLATIGSTTPRNSKGWPINGMDQDDMLYLTKKDTDPLSKILIASCRVKEDFKNKYRSSRITTLDDIEYLIVKLLAQDKAIVVSRHPNKQRLIRTIERLFEMGYVQPFYGWHNRRTGKGNPLAVKPSEKLLKLIKSE